MFDYKLSDFKIDKIPEFHPISQRYERIQFWREHKRACIEGKWHNGIWMPPELYYYINFHNIKFEDDGGIVTSVGLPWLRDIEWEIFYIFTEACGFSGFELDTSNTCHRWYGPEKETALRYGWITEEDLKKKKYIPARDYLRKRHKQNYGKALYENSAKNIMLMGSRGFGKDLKADTVVHRLDGPIPIKDINVGDLVYGADGKLTKVVQKTDYYDQMQYKVTFGDGRSIECGGGHLWNVLKVGEKEYKTLELNDIKDCYRGALRPNGKRDNKYFIPMTEPVEYEEKELPLDPYYLGMWLGDGNSHNPGITTIDEETKEFVYKFADSYGLNVVINHNSKKTCPTYNLSVKRGCNSNPITSKLRKLNVLNNKHIPDLYKYSSIEQRLELVKGLMDSDGHASGKHIEVTFVNEKLTDDLKDILYSLGCKVRKTVKVINGKNYYRLSVITRIPLFKLSRKLVHWETESPSKYQEIYRDSKTNKIPIVDITPTGVAHSVCIGVDNKDSLFLAGDYIVTHNSYILSGIILHNFLFDGARDYDKYLDKSISTNVSESVVGSIDTKYSNDLLNKVKTAYEYLPGSVNITNVFGEVETYPSPLVVEVTGSLAPNKFWQNSRKSLLHHRTFADNPLAANGTRPNRVFLDECFAAGTKVRMADLSVKNIEEIVVGDRVLGADGKPKEVGRVVTGEDLMYKVTQARGADYIVNSKHLLYVEQRCNVNGIDDDGIKLIRAEDFELIGKYRQRTTFGKTSGLIHLEKPKRQKLRIEPYYFGAWLGDGVSESQSIVINKTLDREIYDYISNYSKKLGLTLKEYSNNAGCQYDLVTAHPTKRHGRTNVLRSALRYYNVLGNKRIPEAYLRASEQQRLELLAGLIDTDGYKYSNPKGTSKGYEISVTNREELTNDIVFLARSLGFDVNVSSKIHNRGYDRKILDYRTKYRITIKGEVWRIPCKVERKKTERWNKTTAVNISPLKVECIGEGTYYGITLKATKESDRLFLLEDNTIVHNCGFMSNILETWGAIESTQAAAQHKRLVIFATGTGGLTSAGAAVYTKEIFYNPDDYNCLVFEDIWENKGNIGAFMPATKALNRFKKGENLVTDIAAAERFCNDERKRAEKSSNKIRYLTEVINRPLKPSEIFLRMEGNFFPIDKLKKALAELESNKRLLDASWKVDLELLSDNVVVTKPSDKKVIREFPTRKGTDLDACIEIFEKPKLDINGRPVRGRYLISNDPVNNDGNDDHRRSLQSTFVLDSWTNRIVAEYTARTYLARTYYENVRLLCIYYNAKVLYENNLKGLYEHFRNKKSLYMLEETPDILKDIQLVKSSGTGNRSLGVNMSNDTVKLFAIDLLKEWLVDKIPSQNDDESIEIIDTIRSVGLLQELIAYSMDINADRVSAMLVMMLYIANRKRHIEVAKLTGKSNINEVAADKFWSKAYNTVNKNNNKVYIGNTKRRFSLTRQ